MNQDRYTRHIRLKEFGSEGQQKLSEARILVVGAGGLGIPVLQYLNAMGVGTLGMVEQDIIEETNLHRQVLYTETDIGKPKVYVALQKLQEQNSDTNLVVHDTFLVRDNALEIVEAYDLVVDATDNFATRYLINDACILLKKPMVYGALYGFEGHVSVFNYKHGTTYRCLFPSMPGPSEIPDCNEHGVLGIIPGIIGNLQALEAVKIVTGIGEILSGKLLIYNGLENSFHKISIPLNPENLNISSLEERYETTYCDPSWEISPDQMDKLLAANTPIQLIDVRSAEEFETYHIMGSVNIPITQWNTRLEEISANTAVHLVCQSGVRSLQALQILKENGYAEPLYHLSGGINNYKIHSS